MNCGVEEDECIGRMVHEGEVSHEEEEEDMAIRLWNDIVRSYMFCYVRREWNRTETLLKKKMI